MWLRDAAYVTLNAKAVLLTINMIFLDVAMIKYISYIILFNVYIGGMKTKNSSKKNSTITKSLMTSKQAYAFKLML